MTWKWHWPWQSVAKDTGEEAQAELAKLKQRDEEIALLAEELREMRRRNNFSRMVNEAISRKTREGGA